MQHTFKSLDEFDIVTQDTADRYNGLITQLKGRESNVTIEALEEVKSRYDSELLLFMFNEEGQISGMAQASYHCTPSHYAGYINTVVVDEIYRGQGLGSTLMNELERRAKERWNTIRTFGLTSAPQKGTQGFYLRLGYRMRTKEAGDETIVYVKDVE